LGINQLRRSRKKSDFDGKVKSSKFKARKFCNHEAYF